ncbi:MAG: MFS transporter [Pseudobdellovibrio sp.]
MSDKNNLFLLRWIPVISVLLFSGAQGLLISLYPYLAESLKLSLSDVIFTFSLGSFLFLFGSPFWSSLSDKKGRFNVLLIGLISLAVSFIILAYILFNPSENHTFNLAVLFLSRLIYGFVASAIAPVAQAMHYDISEKTELKNHTQSMFLHSMSLTLGRLLGVMAIMIFTISLNVVFLTYCVVLIFIPLFLYGLYKSLQKNNLRIDLFEKNMTFSESNEVKNNHRFGFKNYFAHIFQQFKNTSLVWIMLIAFVFSSYMEVLNSSLAGVIQYQMMFTSLEAGKVTAKILFLASCIVLLSQMLGRKFLKKQKNKFMYFAVFILLVGSILFVLIQDMKTLWISIVCISIGIGLLPPLYMAELRHSPSDTENSYGKKSGLMSSLSTLGYMVGGVSAAASFKMGFSTTGYVLILLSFLLLAFIYKQYQQKAKIHKERDLL